MKNERMLFTRERALRGYNICGMAVIFRAIKGNEKRRLLSVLLGTSQSLFKIVKFKNGGVKFRLFSVKLHEAIELFIFEEN